MKSTIALLSMMISFTVSAEVLSGLEVTGTFKASRPFYAFNYNSSEDCNADGGEYEDGVCLFKDGGATVEIKKNAEGSFDLAISSVGTNFHLCDYQGTATVKNKVQLTSNDKNADYPGECVVDVLFTSKDSLSITTNGKCQDYCGANMELDQDNATRVK